MSITIEGIDKLVAKLGRFSAFDAIEPAMYRAVYRLEARLKAYPPQPPLSLYRRTGTLGRRWTTAVLRTFDSIEGRVGNNTRYGPWVQSERFQTRRHRRTGWPTDERVVEEERRTIVADFEWEIRRALR